eukprot:5541709-Prymnesium_polylepis.1
MPAMDSYSATDMHAVDAYMRCAVSNRDQRMFQAAIFCECYGRASLANEPHLRAVSLGAIILLRRGWEFGQVSSPLPLLHA